jgi:hypothetical protein
MNIFNKNIGKIRILDGNHRVAVFQDKGFKHHQIQIFSPIGKDGRIMSTDELNTLMQGHNFLHSSASVHVCDLEIILTLSKARTKFVSAEVGGKKVLFKNVFKLIIKTLFK